MRQTLYALSDEQTEYQLCDRLSFMRFVGLALHEPVPDAKTIWLYREQLVCAGSLKRLFVRFGTHHRRRRLAPVPFRTFIRAGGRRTITARAGCLAGISAAAIAGS